MEKLVVVGGNAAGMSAASKAKRVNPSMEVLVFEKSNYVSYAPCGIPYYLSGVVRDIEDLVHLPVKVFREERGIDVRLRSEVVAIDPSGKSVTVLDLGSYREYSIEYDKLVLATGGLPIIPNIPGVDLEGVYTVRSLEDAVVLRNALGKAEKVGVVGGGYVGLEIAEAIVKLGKKPIVFEMLPHILPNFDPEISSIVEKHLVEEGVELHLSEKVLEIEGEDRVRRVGTEKNTYKVDLVILAVGVKPNNKLAREAGLEIGVTGGVRVNERMETSVENVYSAGDNTETKNLITGKPAYYPLAPTANKMGRVAGENAAGGNASFPGALGTAALKLFNLELARTGLSEKEALNEGYDVAAVKIKSTTRSSYYPGAKEIVLKLIVDKASGMLLGAQGVGGEGVVGRVNLLASAITFKANVRDLSFVDLAYSPPFGPVWDPVIVAANVSQRYLRG